MTPAASRFRWCTSRSLRSRSARSPGSRSGASPERVVCSTLDLAAMAFPATRMRRLRRTGVLRSMVRETELSPAHLVQPLFVELGTDSRTPVEAMPGVERLSIALAAEEAGAVQALGIPAVLLFGLPAAKDEQGSGADDQEGGGQP